MDHHNGGLSDKALHLVHSITAALLSAAWSFSAHNDPAREAAHLQPSTARG